MELKNYRLSSERVAYLIEPVRIFDGRIIGYLVLTNPSNKNEYDDDIEILDRLSNYIGSALRRHRDRLREKALNKYRRNLLNPDNLEKIEDEQRYNKIHELITAVTGKRPLYIVTFNRKSQQLSLVYPKSQNNTNQLPDNIEKLIREYIDGRRIQVEEKNGYLLAPMKTKDQVHGCFVLKIKNLGTSDRVFLDRLSDLLAFEQKLLRNQERTRLMVEFSYEINQLHRNEKTALGNALSLVRDYTGKVMATDNMFIALRDDAISLDNKGSNSKPWLRFPLFIKNGQTLEELLESDPGIKNPDRPWNPENTSRTEVIMTEPDREKAVMLCRTKAEAEEYYRTRSNPLNDTLASFLGVPIYLDEDTVGVIAVYHPEKDYCFSHNDQRFLESLAGHVSGLLRLLNNQDLKEANRKLKEALQNNSELKESNRKLEEALQDNSELKKANRKLEEALQDNSELKKANRKLEEAQEEIRKQSEIMSISLLSLDINHKLKNTLGSIMIDLQDISESIPEDSSTQSIAEEAYSNIKNLLIETKKITSNKSETIKIPPLLDKVVTQVIEYRKIPHQIIISKKYEDKNLSANLVYRDIFNCLYIVIDNALQALKTKYQKEKSQENYFQIKTKNTGKTIEIEITDNAEKIPQSISEKTFDFGVTTKKEEGMGYGLWRARQTIRDIGGDIVLKQTEDKKTFLITIPLESHTRKKTAFFIDDEASWRRIIKKWLEDLNYTVHEASSLLEAKNLLEKTESCNINLAICDLSMDSTSSKNIDGLKAIELIKEKNHKTKTVLLSAYTNSISKKITKLTL